MSQHFPLITPPTPTTHIYVVDDMGDTDDPLGGQSECDSDTEDRKVTPITCSRELIDVGLRVMYPIWLEHKCSGIYNFFYPLTHQGSHAFHKNRRKGKRNLPLVDRFVKPSKSAPWFIRIFKGAAFLKDDHPL